jgi:cation diffusion facilitator family transporter
LFLLIKPEISVEEIVVLMRNRGKMEHKERLRRGQILAQKAIFLESGLAAAKVVIGLLSGSLVLISDAIHSVSDLISIITSWLGLKIAQKKANERFPYGFYKAENLGALIISFLILYAAFGMFTQAWIKMGSFSSVKVPLLALGISLLDALVLFFFGRYEIKIGKQVNAQSLIAMGEENKTHLFSSMAVFIGILAAYFKIPYFEGIIAMVISFLILKIGLTTARDSISALMDVSPGHQVEKRVAKVIETVPGIEGFSNLRLRKAGPFVFGEVKLEVRKFVNVQRAHEIADRAEGLIKKKVSQIDSFTIHIEPFKSDFRHLVLPVKAKDGLNSLLSDYFGRAAYFMFVNLKGQKIKGHYFLKNPYKDKSIRAGLFVTKLIAKQKSEILITNEIGEISFHALRDNLTDVYQAKGKTASQMIRKFIKGELDQLEKASRKKD